MTEAQRPVSNGVPLVCMVSGAASGIGRHIANRFFRAGHRLVALDVNREALERAAGQHDWQGERSLILVSDIRRMDDWRQALENTLDRWGRVDVLLNAAGIVRPGFVHELDETEIVRHMETNALGTMFGTHAVAAHMVRQGRGRIINIASLAGIAPVPGIALYTASKFAVRGFSLAVAGELRPHGVQVTVICPDAVQTPMLDDELRYDEAALVFSGSRPLRVEDVAAAVERAMRHDTVEIVLPARRGWLAKVASAWPWLNPVLLPRLWKKGQARQRQARQQQSGTVEVTKRS